MEIKRVNLPTKLQRLIAVLGFAALASIAPLNASAATHVDLWGGSSTASSVSGADSRGRGGNSFEIGQVVRFEGVGEVFFAGSAGGDVYFAMLDELDVYNWQAAFEVCSMKGPGWVVPTAEQMSLLWRNAQLIDLASKEVRQTQGYWHWTASPVDRDFAVRFRAFDGMKQPMKKKFSARVRCARIY